MKWPTAAGRLNGHCGPGGKYHLELRGSFLNMANLLAVGGVVLVAAAALVTSVFITWRKKAYSARQGMGEEAGTISAARS